MAVILGLNAYHGDASAVLLVGDRIVPAVEEERLNRVKHWSGLPAQAAKWCLQSAGLTLADVDHIAVNRNPNANLLKKLADAVTKAPQMALVRSRVRNRGKLGTIKHALEAGLQTSAPKARLHMVEHHRAHLASAFYGAPFDEGMVISVDGFGDFCSVAIGSGRGTHIDIHKRVYFPHSLGVFYTALTQFLGFPHYGDEYKVMGLAPYGEPTFLPKLRSVVSPTSDGLFKMDLRYFIHQTEAVTYEWDDCAPTIGTMYSPALEELLGKPRSPDEPLDQRHKDIARTTQAMYEERSSRCCARI